MKAVEHNSFEDNQSREKIEVIRTLKINAASKAGIILVLLNEKPVANIYAKDETQISEISERCASIGLFSIRVKEIKEDGELTGFSVAVSKSEDLIKELFEITNKEEEKFNHQRYGELMGYPATAIEAYIEDDPEKQMSFEEYNERAEKFLHLFGFKPSKQHSVEEFEVLERWYKLILENAPELLSANR